MRKPSFRLFCCQLLANAVAAAFAVVVIAVVAAAAEPEYEKDDDNPAAVIAIAKIKSTVHKDISFKYDVF